MIAHLIISLPPFFVLSTFEKKEEKNIKFCEKLNRENFEQRMLYEKTFIFRHF